MNTAHVTSQRPGPQRSAARLSGTQVSGARLSGTQVSGAQFSGPQFSGPRFSGPRRTTALAAVALVVLAQCLLNVGTTASASPRGDTAALAGSVLPTSTAPRYVLPLTDAPPPRTSRTALRESGFLVHDFAPPSVRWGAGHRGVDLASGDGDAVLAPSGGVVSFSGVVVDRPLVVISHPDGLRSTLEPVSESPPVGTVVARGAPVGVLHEAAQSHCAPAACVHWGVRRGTDYVDPLALVGAVEPITLLPRK